MANAIGGTDAADGVAGRAGLTPLAALYGCHQDRYLELIRQFPLRPLAGDADLAAAVRAVDGLIDLEELSRAEDDYLAVLARIVEEYEEVHCPAGGTPADGVLAYLMELREYTQAQVAEGAGIAASTVSEILAGRRRMNLKQVVKLAAFFGVGPAVFLSAPTG